MFFSLIRYNSSHKFTTRHN